MRVPLPGTTFGVLNAAEVRVKVALDVAVDGQLRLEAQAVAVIGGAELSSSASTMLDCCVDDTL